MAHSNSFHGCAWHAGMQPNPELLQAVKQDFPDAAAQLVVVSGVEAWATQSSVFPPGSCSTLVHFSRHETMNALFTAPKQLTTTQVTSEHLSPLCDAWVR